MKLIELPKLTDSRGNLSFFECNYKIPFEIKKLSWIYDVQTNDYKRSYALMKSQEFIVPLSGSLDVNINDGVTNLNLNLNHPFYGLYLPKMLWRSIENFSTNSRVIIVSSNGANESDYVYNYQDFMKLINAK